MQRSRSAAVLAVLVAAVAGAGSARSDVKVTVDHNAAADCKPEFTFKSVPSPAKGATGKAKATIVSGEKDDDARDVDALTTGPTPTEEDQPESNFFFNAGTPGGRVGLDLGAATPLKQVNTYSWHPSTRGPQVYKLYAADGAAKGFNAAPKAGTDPATCGWTLLANVDTRQKDGEPGGQYGVSVADSAGGNLGTYRYLLIDTSTTETDDDFGNTFFSRVDVVQAK